MSEKKKVLSRADFLGASQKLKRELVDVPALGGAVYLREVSVSQMLAYNARLQSLQAKGKKKVTFATSIELMALLLSMTACDEDGNLLFTEADVKALADNSPAVLLELSVKAMQVSGMNSAAIKEVAANLKKARSGSSVST